MLIGCCFPRGICYLYKSGLSPAFAFPVRVSFRLAQLLNIIHVLDEAFKLHCLCELTEEVLFLLDFLYEFALLLGNNTL